MTASWKGIAPLVVVIVVVIAVISAPEGLA
jgi:hypothetical protein